jgi:hypothetical protein
MRYDSDSDFCDGYYYLRIARHIFFLAGCSYRLTASIPPPPPPYGVVQKLFPLRGLLFQEILWEIVGLIVRLI